MYILFFVIQRRVKKFDKIVVERAWRTVNWQRDQEVDRRYKGILDGLLSISVETLDLLFTVLLKQKKIPLQ